MDIDIRTLLAKLNPVCKRALEQAAQRCVQQTHYNVELEHLLWQLVDGGAPDVASILAHYGIRPDLVLAQLQTAIDAFKRGNGRTPALAPQLAPWLQEAWLLASMVLGEQSVRSGTLLLALLELDSLRGVLLESAPALLQIAREPLRNALPTLLAASAESAATPARATGSGAAPGAGDGAGQMPAAVRASAAALDLYTVDLTLLARQQRIDPVRGRDAEIRQIIDVLLRRRQNNPILTGEAGVGKTAVVEGFALRVVQGLVPAPLRGVCVRALDLALLQAGAGIRGEFESRLKSVIAEVKASATPIVLFIDEAHQLIGAGGAEGQGDAANLLKPALARGELRTIAATTWAEYKKYVERDPALARRFQLVQVDEPDEESAVDMLRGTVASLQAHHGVEILDEAVRDAVRLSQRYISGRQLPDKAVAVLDTACARVAIAQSGVPPELEDLQRRIEATQNQLRVCRRETDTGLDRQHAVLALQAELAQLQHKNEGLREKLDEERRAVMEIVALRSRLLQASGDDVRQPAPGASDASVCAAPALDGDDDAADPQQARAALTATLVRLEKGLEALRSDEPLVPVNVDAQAVASVVSAWTGVPMGRMLADEVHTVLNLQSRLAERVVGQDQALDAIARRVRSARADLDDPGKPVGVFLLVGPSGVGKTETAHALAEQLFGGERNTITVNMSEFQEAHSVSSLKGAPPGYVGYGKGGVLTEAVRRKPYSVLLLDEMEKAHPDVLELFYQVFDKGSMEDGEGVRINFKNTLILLTSNAAQDVITDACAGGERPSAQALMDVLRPALLRQFAPAFLGRVSIVPYYPLGDVQIRAIVRLKLEKLRQRMLRAHRCALHWEAAVEQQIAARCTEVESGARTIDHILAHTLLPELSRLVLERIALSDPFDRVDLHWDAAQGFVYGFSDAGQGGAGDA